MNKGQIKQHNTIAAKVAIPKLFAMRNKDNSARIECKEWIRIYRQAKSIDTSDLNG